MIQLYYSPRTRAVRVRWLLEEMGLPYELIRLNLNDLAQSHSDYGKVHPHGAVPAIRDGELTLFESGAICAYLCEKYADKGFAPSMNSPQRPLYWQWMFYGPGTFEGPFVSLFQQTRGLPENERSPQVLEKARADFNECALTLENALQGKSFLLGESISAADIMLGHSLLNAKRYEMLAAVPGGVPNLLRYLTALESRPARTKANAD